MSSPQSDTVRQHRPPTHKPRGLCKYYTTPRGCFAGDNCKFLHGVLESSTIPPEGAEPSRQNPLLTPYDQSKVCRYYLNGFCRRGDSCWFQHILGSDKGKSKQEEEPLQCSICFETPVTFGLLVGCNHIFCVTCIKEWRDPAEKSVDVVSSGNTKKCPMCRTPSHFVAPSSFFAEHGTLEKQAILQSYRDSMSRVPCKYFQQSKSKPKRMCPFGKDCFYKHENEDGTPFAFTEGADVWMRKFAQMSSPRRGTTFFGFDEFDEGFLDTFFPGLSLQTDSIPLFGGISLTESVFTRRSVAARPPPDVDVADGNRPTREEAFRSLEEVGRTLDAVSQAFDQSANIGQLATSLQRIRNQTNANANALLRGRRRRNRQADEDRLEEDAMERLEILADQMLTSVSVLRNSASRRPREHSQTPPPLESIETQAPGPLVLSDSDEVYGDMPVLHSVSNSSEDDSFNDFDSSSNEDEDLGMHFYEGLNFRSSATTDALINGLARPLLEPVLVDPPLPVDIDQEDGDDDADADDEGDEEDYLPVISPLLGYSRSDSDLPDVCAMLASSLRNSTTQNRDTDGHDDDDPGESMPELASASVSSNSEQENDVDDGLPTLESTITASSHSEPSTSSPTSLSQSTSPTIVEPPFVTDGRGRVVWSSSDSQAQQGQSPGQSEQYLPAFPPTSKRNVSISMRPAAATPPVPTSPTSHSHRSNSTVVVETIGTPNDSGFTTDGRGHVIGTGVPHGTAHQGSPTVAVDTSSSPPPRPDDSTSQSPTSRSRNVLGRVLTAFIGTLSSGSSRQNQDPGAT